MARPTVVIGMLGTVLDGGFNEKRLERWRPSVSLVQHPELPISRFELICPPEQEALARRVAADITALSPGTQVVTHAIAIPDPWDFEAVYAALHDFARARAFQPEQEDTLVHITTGTHVAQICLFLLTESRVLPARLIQSAPEPGRRGGPGRYTIIDLDLSRYDRLAARFQGEHQDAVAALKSGIDTKNAKFNALIERIGLVAARSRAPLLLTGPTGAGKSQLAARIFELKRQRRQVSGAFVPVNCATLRGDAAMSALFGHVRGSYTGATGSRPGLLRAADRGVLFLDEIGELGADEQAMLLRALEHRRFTPMGSDEEVGSDFQLIAGTNEDLAAAARSGRFRPDLLARINLWTFALPALRERPEDIAPNLDYELDQFAARHGARPSFSREARQRFLAFAEGPGGLWLANFRDLNAAVVRMGTLAPGGRITLEVVEEEIGRLQAAWGAGGGDRPGRVAALLPGLQLDRFERVQLEEVLEVCARSRTLSEAGRALFAVSRAQRASQNDADRLRKYLARFGLDGADVLGG